MVMHMELGPTPRPDSPTSKLCGFEILSQTQLSKHVFLCMAISTVLGSNTSVSSIKDFALDLLQRIMEDRADQVRYPIMCKFDAEVKRLIHGL